MTRDSSRNARITRTHGSRFSLLIVTALLAVAAVTPATAQTIGMVADDFTNRVIVFDADTNSVLGSVPISEGGAIGDCSVTGDQSLGFVTNFGSEIWVIDLAASPPALASGLNPIPISNNGEDTALTPDSKFLLVCDGSLIQPVSSIDVATRTEVSTFALGTDCTSVNVCDDGSVLVTSGNGVRRLVIDAAGTLTDTGDVLASNDNVNVYCSPGSATGVVVRAPSALLSFTIPGLLPIEQQLLTGGEAVCGLITRSGDLALGRSNGGLGLVEGWVFDSVTGDFGAKVLDVGVSTTLNFFGMDQMALEPTEQRLYVPVSGGLRVYDVASGSLLTTITHPDIVSPTDGQYRPAQP